MSDFKLEFPLRQHTPHIHFQHEQAGATLRATELKPKFDKFVIEKLGGEQILQARHPEWFVGGDEAKHPALNYKVRLDTAEETGKKTKFEIEVPKFFNGKPDIDSRTNRQKTISFPGYFANLGQEKEEQKQFTIYDALKITIVSMHTELLAELSKNFPEFLATHNFGSRQSKGFGGYYLAEADKFPVKNFIKYQFSLDVTSVVLPNYVRFPDSYDREFILFYKLFYALNLFYSTMRSGVNFGGFYFKSLMFQYAKDKNIQWDKKAIRDHFHLFTDQYRDLQRTRTDPSGAFLFSAKEKRLMRDMLGLSTDQSWMSYGDVISKEDPRGDSEGIGRFKSPIFFKVLRSSETKFQIFIKAEKIPDEYFGARFKITSKKYQKEGKSDLMLQTPTTSEFQLEDYLEFCFKRVFKNDQDFEKYTQNASSPEARLLKNIYSQLRNC